MICYTKYRNPVRSKHAQRMDLDILLDEPSGRFTVDPCLKRIRMLCKKNKLYPCLKYITPGPNFCSALPQLQNKNPTMKRRITVYQLGLYWVEKGGVGAYLRARAASGPPGLRLFRTVGVNNKIGAIITSCWCCA